MKMKAKSFYIFLAILLSGLAVIFGMVSSVWALNGSISLSMPSGPVGATVHVDGSGFTPGTFYSIRFGTSVVMTGTVTSDNTVANEFTVPSLPRNTYQVTVTTVSDNSNAASFSITPLITLDTTSGRAGSQVKVSGSGFTASSAVTIMVDGTSVGTTTASTLGAFSNYTITIPTLTEGSHTITARDSAGSSPAVNFSTTVARISLSKASGHIGDRFAVSGSGFSPNASVTVLFDSVGIGSASTDSSGTFANFAVAVPGSAAGDHHVAARDAIGVSPEVTFSTLAPEITLGQNSGKVGDQITVSGLGFVPGASVNILLDDSSFASVAADAAGKFTNAPVTVPAGAHGRHTVAGKDTFNTSAGVSFEIIQSLVVNPVTGIVGSEATINGHGFNKSSAVTLAFDGAAQLVNAVADASGSFTASFRVPEAASGEHIISVRDNGGNEASVAFTVVASFAISPDSGPSGATVKANGYGFKADVPVAIRFNGTPLATSPETLVAGSHGSFSVSFEVPPCLAGSYAVEASDGINRAGDEFISVLAATISQITSETAPGHVGMQINIKGAGFNPNARITVTRASIQTPMVTALTSPEGIFSVDFTMPPAPGGKHTLIVTDGTNTREFPLYIEQEPPAVPVLLKPETGSKATSPAYFKWKDVTDESGITYAIQIAPDDRFDNILIEEDGLTALELTLAKEALKPVTREHPYYWRVKAIDGASNESQWSEARPFSVGFVLTLPNGEPELILPAMMVYGTASSVIVLIVLGFFLGRKFAPYR